MTVFTRLILLCLCLIASSSVQASQQEKLDKLRQRISTLQQNLEKTSASKSEAADALRESERAISTSNRALAELTQQQREENKNLQQLQQQMQKLKAGMQGQQALLSKLLYQQYVAGKQEYLKLLLNNHHPDQVARDLRYFEYIARSRAAQIKILRGNLAQVNTIAEQTRQKNMEIARLQATEKMQKRNLEKDQGTRQKVLAKIARQLKQQRLKIGRLQRDENHLSQLVSKLSKILSQSKEGSGWSNNKLPDDRFDGKPFNQLKGKLALPVKGKISNKFGSARPDSTILWRGLLIQAASGQAVKAVAAGRVVFADWLRGFGNLLIVDHGQNYLSLYGNNETLYKQVGDSIKGGDTVATVGNTGGNEDAGLYFELRYKGEPMDPMRWVAK